MTPWWADTEKLAYLVMATLVICVCAFLLAGTGWLIRLAWF